MLNTCSIGRRWKSREGWSRPVLTGERGTLFPIPCGSGLVLWWFSRWMARNAVSCGHDDDTGKAFDLLASVVRFPDRHDRNRGWFRFCRPPVFRLAVLYWFCGGHGPGETPGPFPNPEAKAWHGDGTALERVWESSAPPHSTVWTFWSSPLGDSRKVPFFILLGVPAGRNAPETPIFCFSSGFFRAFTDLPATPFRLVEGVFPWLASLSFLRTSRPGIHDSPKGSSPIRGLPADAGRGRPVFLS